MTEKTDKIIGYPNDQIPVVCSKCGAIREEGDRLLFWRNFGDVVCANCACEDLANKVTSLMKEQDTIKTEYTQRIEELIKHGAAQINKAVEDKENDHEH